MLLSPFVCMYFLAVAAIATEARGSKVVLGAYIFEFEDGEDHADFDSILAEGGKSRLNFDYKFFKGVSVQLDDLDHAEVKSSQMASSRGVKNVWPVEIYDLPENEVAWTGSPSGTPASLLRRGGDSSSNNSYSPHVMTQIDRLHEEGYRGKGVKIAVIDSGVDYNHPALGGCFGEGCVITHGYDLVGDDYTGSESEPVPDDDPMDCRGHGTHTIGILAAQENDLGIIGAAPEAEIWAYKVFGCTGGAGSDMMIAAIYQAFEDGADIISMSLGELGGWFDAPIGRAASDVVSQGTPCVFSAGNNGYDGMWKASSAAAGDGVTGVGSVYNTLMPTVQYISSYSVDGQKERNFSYTPGYPPGLRAWDDVQLPLWLANESICESLPEDVPNLSNKIVLIQKSDCLPETVAATLFSAGGQYFFVASDGEDAPTVYFDLIDDGIKGAATVVSDVGSKWIEALEGGSDVEISMIGPENADSVLVSLPNRQTGGAMSGFSSQGPTWDLGEVKPSFSAPGGWILSLLPLDQGGFSVQSGTSCSTPLVAGAYALVSQIRGTLDPATLRQVFATTSDPLNFHDETEFFDYLAPVPQQGGGIIRAFDAAYVTTLVEASQLSFRDSRTRMESLNLTVVNESGEQVTYEIGSVPTVSVYTFNDSSIYPYQEFPNAMVDKHASLSFSETKFTLSPEASLMVSVTADDESIGSDRLPVWSGWVTVNGTDGTALSLPYQGVRGSLYEQTILPRDGAWISASDRPQLGDVPNGTKFTLPRPNSTEDSNTVFPLVVSFLALGTKTLRADVVPLDKDHGLPTEDFFGTKGVGQVAGFPDRDVPRGKTSDPLATEWHGMLDTGEFVPEGKYKIVLRALKIFGDPKKEDDWDVVDAGTLRIEYAES